MAKNASQPDHLPKAPKLLIERLAIDETRSNFGYHTESDEMPEQVELFVVNAETGQEIRVPMTTSSKAVAPSGRRQTLWRNVSKTTPEALASEIGPGQWRCYLMIDNAMLYRPSLIEGLLEEPLAITSDFFDLKFYRSPAGLFSIDIQRRNLVPVQDLLVEVQKVRHAADHTLRIAGTIQLFGKPLSNTPCELQLRSRDGGNVMQSVTITPVDGAFKGAFPAGQLVLGVYDIVLGVPSTETVVRVRYPESLDQNDTAQLSSNQAGGAVATAYRTKSGNLAVYVTPAPAHFEISKILTTHSAFMISGAVSGSENPDGEKSVRKILSKYQCFAVGRDTGDEIELGVTFEGTTFHIKFSPRNLADIDFGIWDIAMKSPRGELSFLSPASDSSRESEGIPIVWSSVAGAAAAIECLSDTPHRVTVNVQPLLKSSQLEHLAIGSRIEAVFTIETRGVPVDRLFTACKTALLVSQGTARAHRMPARTHFSPTGPFTCRVRLDCELAGAAPERLRQIISNCSLGLELNGPNIEGTVPLDCDDRKIFARGLKAAIQRPWMKSLSPKRGEIAYRLYARGLSVRHDLALFQNFGDESYAGNARAISEALARRAPQIRQVWALNDPEQHIPHAHAVVRPGSSNYYRHLAQARYFIGDAELPAFAVKRPGTLHLQTGQMMTGEMPDSQTISRWDIALSPNTYVTRRLQQSLDFKGEIIQRGNPRNDLLVDPAARHAAGQRVRAALGIHPNKSVVLYVPQQAGERPPISLRSLQKALGQDHVLLLRLPREVANGFDWPGAYQGFVVNVSKYEAMSDLLCAADILLTDMSPSMVDFSLTGRPMIFYLRDKISLDPDFVPPGPLVRKQSGVTRALGRSDEITKKYAQQYKAFVEDYCSAEHGTASDEIVTRLLRQAGVTG